MTVPDEVAESVASEATERGTSVDVVVTEALASRTAVPPKRSFPFIAMFEAPPGYDVQRAEEDLEAEGFTASS